MPIAPIVLFTYRKLDSLKQVVEALQRNYLARESDLYIFSDGYKGEQDKNDVLGVRQYLSNIEGFKNVYVNAAEKNIGLAGSIITGVSMVIEKHGKVIVLEDDLITSANFLVYMNRALNFYQDNAAIFSISGFSFPLKFPASHPFDNYFTMRASSWGWATWIDRWKDIDWSVSDYKDFSRSLSKKHSFNRMGSDMTSMLCRQMKGSINSWAIRWCYHQFKHQLFTVVPCTSKVMNIGFGGLATNTKGKNERYATTLGEPHQIQFRFDPVPVLDESIIKQFVSRFSIKTRLMAKISQLTR